MPQRYHGRVFALNQIDRLVDPADRLRVLAPLGAGAVRAAAAPGGALAGTVGAVIGTGPGRGIALMYLVGAAALAVLAAGRPAGGHPGPLRRRGRPTRCPTT